MLKNEIIVRLLAQRTFLNKSSFYFVPTSEYLKGSYLKIGEYPMPDGMIGKKLGCSLEKYLTEKEDDFDEEELEFMLRVISEFLMNARETDEYMVWAKRAEILMCILGDENCENKFEKFLYAIMTTDDCKYNVTRVPVIGELLNIEYNPKMVTIIEGIKGMHYSVYEVTENECVMLRMIKAVDSKKIGRKVYNYMKDWEVSHYTSNFICKFDNFEKFDNLVRMKRWYVER